MAEINTGTRNDGQKRTSTKKSTRVDMTAMVDLAFLLITFFMLTTTMSKPKVMMLNMPYKGDDKQPVKNTKTTTIVLGKNDRIYYYTGIKDPIMNLTDYSANGIRKVILQKRNTIDDPIFIIKSMDECRYQNMVDILDEMWIAGAGSYSLVDITQTDLDLVSRYNQQHNLAD